jgi:WD40 repeat protein
MDMASTNYIFQVLVEHSSSVVKVVINSDGSNVISGASDGSIMMWSVASGEYLYKLNNHTMCITTLNLLANEQFVISCTSL